PTLKSPSRAASRSRSTAPSCAAQHGRTRRYATATPSRSSAQCREDESCAYPENQMSPDPFKLAGETFASRLLLGTPAYPTRRTLAEAGRAGGCEIVPASIRRISLHGHGFDTVDVLSKYRFLPNTAGCETAHDAIRTAELAREALDTNWVKLEVIGDRETLYPDVTELIEATRRLTDDGFVVLPYCTDDPVVCQRL